MRNTRGAWPALHTAIVVAACGIAAAQQAPLPPAPAAAPATAWVAVKPIDPPSTPLPSESASAKVTRFTFVAYGDTRSESGPGGDAEIVHPEHSKVVDRVLQKVRERASTAFPVRFVLQSGDAVLRGQNGAMWNIGFTPIIERLTRANIPYFFATGNHDVTTAPAGDPERALGLHNTLTAMSKLLPPEGSPRRLAGYPTYAFGYGNAFFVAIDSNIAADPTQLSWVANQLAGLDRARYTPVIAFFHHPPYSSGPHGGGSADPVPGTGRKAPDRVEAQTAAIRTLYMPLFRKHHVRMLVTGHDHLYDHWVERYDEAGVTYRMDTLVTGGGGAPLYGYIGEPDLRAYISATPAANIKMEHLMKPGLTAAENRHHFVLVQVDGDKLSIEVIGTGETPYAPFPGGVAKISLDDKRPGSQ
jgi:hypothetical protein